MSKTKLQKHTAQKEIVVPSRKRIILIAHDNKKHDLIAWVKLHQEQLAQHDLFATGTTGIIICEETKLSVHCFESGPLGGDMQAGAFIAEGKIDLALFFWDPLEPQPHDPDIKALLRIAVVWNIPLACNEATADFIVSSPYFNGIFNKNIPDFTSYKNRKNKI